MNKKSKKIDFSNMPVSSSLGHLAYGDLAFRAWRKIKVGKNTNRVEGLKDEEKK